jgi:hypothetical protein
MTLHPRDDYRFEARFGKVIAAVGIAAVPRALFYYMGELGLSYADVGFISHILSFRWTSDVPYPGVEKLALQAGCSASTIQRRRQALEALGYCTIVPRFRDTRQTSNGYDLSALFERLESCIRRDWLTVWKDRDPMVGDDEPDDPFAIDRPPIHHTVDNIPKGRTKATPLGRDTATPTGRGFATQQDRVAATRRTAESLPHEEEQSKHMPWSKEGESTRTARQKTTIRATEIRVAPENQHGAQATSGRLRIQDAMDAYTHLLHDGPKSRSGNRTRALRLWATSGLDDDSFLALLEAAHARAAQSRPRAAHAAETNITSSRVPYFFAVLEDLIDSSTGDACAGVWRRTLRQLKTALRADLVRDWLVDATLVDLAGAGDEQAPDRATVAIPDPVGRAKFAADYHGLLQRALSSASGRQVVLTVVDTP